VSQSQTETIDYSVHVRFRQRQRELRRGASPPPLPAGRIPRLTRLMALAIRLEQLLDNGVIPSQAVLARLGHVTPARLTQIISLRQLAPDIQEEILFLPPIEQGREPLTERRVRPLLGTLSWPDQRLAWARLTSAALRNKATEGPKPGADF
jgi:hypothetical protein